MNAKQEQKERSHETILDSAARLLRTNGISGARVADVMKGAGLTVGGFYAHFETKRALIDATLRRTAEQTREQLFAGLEDKPEHSRAEIVLKRYLSAAHRDADTLGCPLPAVVGEVATAAPEHGPALAESVEALVQRMIPLLATKRSAASRRQVALGLVALMFGGLGLARALRGTQLSDEVLRACRAVGKAVIEACELT